MTGSRNSDGAQFMGAMLLICGNCLSFLYGLVARWLSHPGSPLPLPRTRKLPAPCNSAKSSPGHGPTSAKSSSSRLSSSPPALPSALSAVIVGTLLCLVGLIITIPLAILLTGLFQYHLYGQLAYSYPYPAWQHGGHSVDPILTTYTPPAATWPLASRHCRPCGQMNP